MKKLLALILCFALLITAVMVPMSVSAETTLISTSEIIDWDGRATVSYYVGNTQNVKGQYIRPKVLSDGKVGAAWYVMGEGGRYGVSTDGGINYAKSYLVVQNDWETTAEQRLAGEYGRGKLEVQNPNFIEMEDGTLLYTYRYNTYTSEPNSTNDSTDDPDKIKAWDTYYTSIRYQLSTDGGQNWSDPVIIIEQEYDDPTCEEGQAGYWEPEPVYINGELYIYWCDTVTGKPDFSYQHIRGAKWNGTGFDASFIAVDGKINQSREGMCVVTELADGSYAMVFESTDTDSNTATHNNCGDWFCTSCDNDGLTFVIKISRSKDGVNWTKPVTVAKPEKLVSEDIADKDGALAVCASPYIITLPDGRLAISYQTSDLYTGDVIPDAVVRRSVVQVAISDIAVGYDTEISTSNFNKIAESPAEIGDNQFANAGSLLYNDGRLLAYAYIGTNSYNEDGSVTSKADGIRVGYINLEKEKDYNDINRYIYYNSKSNDITIGDNGSFITPADSAATKLIAGEKAPELVEYEEPVLDLYNAAKWNTFADKFTFNTDNIAIATGATKAYMLGTEQMKDFNASATFQGNSGGSIYAGFAFHLQTEDFDTASFNTLGYSAFVKREKADLDKAVVIVRYCKAGASAGERTTLTVTGLGTAIDLKLRLDVTVKDDKILTSLYDANGNLLGKGDEYPLDYTATLTTSEYCESGAFGIISNGVHTVTNLSVAEIVTSGAVKGIYDSAYWNTYADKFTFDEGVISIKSGATKAYLLNTEDMEDFTSSVTLQGNTAGSIYAGVAFHLQTADFNLGSFNTSGYSVFVKRNSETGYDKAEIHVRYCVGKDQKGEETTLTVTGLNADDLTLKLRLDVTVKDGKILTSLYSEDGTLLGTGDEYPLDYTATDTDTQYYESGAFGIISNGVHTFTNLSVNRLEKEIIVDKLEQVGSKAFAGSAEFKLTETLTAANQAGFAFRVQDATNSAPGLTGYVLYIYYATTYEAGQVKYQLIRYGTKSDGTLNQNLGVMGGTVDLGAGFLGDATVGKTLILSFVVEGDKLTVNAKGKESGNVATTKTFDLNTKSTAASVEYTDYYEDGGYGFYKFGPQAIEISNAQFGYVKEDVDNINPSDFTVYSPESSKGVELGDGKIVSLDAETKKIILNDTMVSDFSADATFEAGEDGNIKGGIIFRAQNVGNETDAMEGYSVTLWKNAHTTGNSGRIVLMLYKWGRDADGNLTYLGEIARLVDTTTINAVYPDAQKSILAAVGAHIKLNVSVEGTTVTAWFDVLDENNNIGASSNVAEFDLTGEIENSKEAVSTLYNYGNIGASISTKGALCDFNVDADEYTKQILNAENFTEYTSNTYNFTTVTNDEIYSKLGGVKRLVDWTQNIEDFKITSRFKAFSETAQAFGFDFGLDSNEWNVVSGGSTVTTSTVATQYNSGYRITFSRVNKTSSDLRIYFSTYSSDGNGGYISSNEYTTVTDFFAEYYAANSKYTGAEMDVEVKLDKDGNLTSKASLVGYTATAEYTVTGVSASGAYGIYMNNGGTLTGTKVALSNTGDIITAADCENGFVYAATNSGAANVGDTVTIVPKAADGYAVNEVSYTVNGEKTVVEAVDGVYAFSKVYGATEIAATFKEAGVAGDLSGDGKLDGEDLVCLCRILLGVCSEYDANVADFTGNGTVDVRDLVAIKAAIAANAEA